MRLLFSIVSGIRRIYWFIFRPKTVGVKCLIECNGDYLLIKHTYGSRRHNWNLPGGGIKKSEVLSNAVKREVFEELGIGLSNITELKKYTSNAEYKIDTIHCFYAKVTNKKIRINKNELLEAAWFSKNNLPENLSRSIKETVSSLLN